MLMSRCTKCGKCGDNVPNFQLSEDCSYENDQLLMQNDMISFDIAGSSQWGSASYPQCNNV